MVTKKNSMKFRARKRAQLMTVRKYKNFHQIFLVATYYLMSSSLRLHKDWSFCWGVIALFVTLCIILRISDIGEKDIFWDIFWDTLYWSLEYSKYSDHNIGGQFLSYFCLFCPSDPQHWREKSDKISGQYASSWNLTIWNIFSKASPLTL